MNLKEFAKKNGNINVSFAKRVISQTHNVDELLQYWFMQDLVGSIMLLEAFQESCKEDMASAFDECDKVEAMLKLDMKQAKEMILGTLRDRLQKEEFGTRFLSDVIEKLTSMIWDEVCNENDLKKIVCRFRHNAFIAKNAISAYQTSITGR